MNADMIQQLLARMQQNAQANVPVIPNNGNPMGANNMPAMTGAGGEDNTGGHYPWMQPSPSMNYLHNLIASMGTGGPAQVQPAPVVHTGGTYPAVPVPGNTGVMPPQMSTGLPAQQVPTAPAYQGGGTKVVMPQYSGPYGRTYTR